MKILRKSVIVLLLLGGTIVGAGLLISQLYGDEVERAVIDGLNDRLRVEVDVEEVDFSVLRKFPYASVSFSRASLKREGDTLFHFERVHLQFDLIDLVRGQERIDRISFENGQFLLPIDERGEHPYDDLWKGDAEERKKGSRFELERLEWENVTFHYVDRRTESSFQTRVGYAFLQGSFSDERTKLRAQLEGSWNELELGDRAWHGMDRHYSVRTKGRIHSDEERIRIGESSIHWTDMEGELDGNIEYGEGARLDLQYRLPYHELEAYIDAWPGLFSKPDGHGFEGRIRVEGEWKGPMGRGNGPTLRGGLTLKEGAIEHEASGVRAEDLRAGGRFSTRNEQGRAIIELDRFKGDFGGGEWQGKGHFSFGTPHRVELHLKGKSSVEESVRFLGIDTVRRAEGDWSTSFRVKGPLADPRTWTPERLERLSISGQAELKDATIALKAHPQAFEALNGSFLLDGVDAAIRNLSGSYAGNELNLEGRFYDLLPYLFFPDRTLRVQAELRSPGLDLDPVLNTGSSSSERYQLEFPEDLRFTLRTDLDTLRFREFEARDLSGSFELGPGGLLGKGISMRIAEGELDGHLALNGKTRPYGVRASARLKNVKLRPLFRAFESFGQELVRPEHLRGIIDADVRYGSSLQKDLGVPPASVSSSADLEIRKGELIGFRPLIGLGEELANKKVLASFLDLEGLAERLHHIRFETLRNRIRVENEKVIIPRFDIRSNALDILANGEHGFDGRIDHHFTILMDELLSKPKKSEFGYLRDEGEKKRLFVKMDGTTDDPDISFDREAAQEHRKKEREEEKKEVKDVLRKEFGLFGGEDSLSSPEEKKEGKGEPAFEVEWGKEKEENEKESSEKEKEEGKSIWDRLGIGKEESEEKEEDD